MADRKQLSLKLPHVLDDLCSRFIINLPEEELHSFERICFQIEAAHWFYEDFYREQDPKLPPTSLKLFARQMFEHCPVLRPYLSEHSIDEIFASFTHYKTRVPVCGAILLNMALDKCLLVKGWHSRSSWGFPKGKINKDEPELDCAKREVYEETGYEIPDGLITEEDYIEFVKHEQRMRLYIVPYVPEDTPFAPRTRKEISKIKWHLLKELPSYNSKQTPGVRRTENFFMVSPVLGRLKKWIQVRRQQDKRPGPSSTTSSSSSSSSSSTITNGGPPLNAPKKITLLRNTPAPLPSIPSNTAEGKGKERMMEERPRRTATVAAANRRLGSRDGSHDGARPPPPGFQEAKSQASKDEGSGAMGPRKESIRPPNPLLTFQFDVAAIRQHLPPAH